jgi:hypothetical protein
MKCLAIPVISILLICCNETSLRRKQTKQIDEDWKLEAQTFSSNSYTPGGLLDTTSSKTYSYFNGILMDTINSIIIRHYDNNNLISEKDFILYGDGTKELTNETTNHF